MQLKTDKAMSELDNFLIRNNQQPTPRRSYVTSQQPKGQQNILRTHQTKENQPLIHNVSRSPARSASKKTLSSHQNSQSSMNLSRQRAKSRRSCRVLRHHCENHEEVQGVYRINIQGEDLFYCQKCAYKLKNQGFPVKFENVSKDSRRRIQTSQNSSMISSYPHLDGNPQFETLKVLLTHIYESQAKLRRTQTQNPVQGVLQKAFLSFEDQMDKIEELVRFHREEGKNLFNKMLYDCQKKPSPAQDELFQALREIQVMKNDIQSNIQLIVHDVDESTFQHCVQSYRSRIEELNITTASSMQYLDNVKKQFERSTVQTFEALKIDLDNLLGKKYAQEEDDDSMICNEGISSDKSGGQSRGAFRNLFGSNRPVSRQRGLSKK